MKLLLLVVVGIALLATIDGKNAEKREQTNANEEGTVCADTLGAGEMATCAGHAYTRQKISVIQFEDYLHKALAKLPSDKVYYSVGWQSSHEPGLMIAEQTHYKFDWSHRLPVDPRQVYKTAEVVFGQPVRRPVLLYTFGNEMLEEAARFVHTAYHPSGGEMRKKVFKMDDTAHAVGEHTPVDCVNYTGWLEKEKIRGKHGLVVLADAKYWCPELARVHFEVVLGEYKKVEGAYHPVWEISSGHSLGNVPAWADQVFR